MKRKLHLIIYVTIIVLLTGCAQQPRKYVIGVSQCSEDVWRDKLNDELKMGEYLNDSLLVKLASSNDDNVLQNKQVNQFIDEGVDLLIVSPNQLSAISKSVERAYDKGIPVILYECYQALSWVTGCSLGGGKLERRGWNPGDETHIETDTGL